MEGDGELSPKSDLQIAHSGPPAAIFGFWSTVAFSPIKLGAIKVIVLLNTMDAAKVATEVCVCDSYLNPKVRTNARIIKNLSLPILTHCRFSPPIRLKPHP